ncbi:MAG TPA: MarR family transcriptional regulator [Elusimicrobiales bacterium]|nr:MarR family transcriptional regulator [Elusimicrobiales bacterium]
MNREKFLLKNMPRGSKLDSLAAVYPQADLKAMEIFSALLETSSDILSAINSALARVGVSQARFRLLLHLRRAGKEGLHPMDLAVALGVGRATVTGLVDGVERAGLACRLPCSSDRRSIMVALTPEGVTLIDSIAPGRLRRVAGLMEGFSSAEKTELARLLDKVKINIPAFRKI